GDEEPEPVGEHDAETGGAVGPEQNRGEKRAGEADGAERTDRHPLAWRSKRLGDHGGQGGRRHAGHRHDRVPGSDVHGRDLGLGIWDSRGSGFANPESHFPNPLAWMRAGAPLRTWFNSRSTDGSIGFRNMFGNTPITIAIATI